MRTATPDLLGSIEFTSTLPKSLGQTQFPNPTSVDTDTIFAPLPVNTNRTTTPTSSGHARSVDPTSQPTFNDQTTTPTILGHSFNPTILPPFSDQTTILTSTNSNTTATNLPVSFDQNATAGPALVGTAQTEVIATDHVSDTDSFSGTDDLFLGDDVMWSELFGGEGPGDVGWGGGMTGDENPFNTSHESAGDTPVGNSIPWPDHTSSIQSAASITNTGGDIDPVLSLFPDDLPHVDVWPDLPLNDPSVPVYPPTAHLDDEQVYSPHSLPQDSQEERMHVPQPQPRSHFDHADDVTGPTDEITDDDDYLGSLRTNRQPQNTPTDWDSADDGSRFDMVSDWDNSTQLGQGTTKRKRSAGHYRVIRSRQAPLAPSYPIVESEQIPGQSKAIDWRRLEGKRSFNLEFAKTLLRLGGVKSTHQGTCVVGPDIFRSLGPTDLLYGTQPEQLAGLLQPMMYEYSDYRTEFVRAAAFFRSDDWPHTGFSFDNFLGVRLYRLMVASHPCHQDHCLIHVTYETVDTKRDRERCAEWAKAARCGGQEVPPTCSVHNPPCLLQVMASPIFGKYII